MKTLQHGIEYLAFLWASFLIRHIPLSWAQRWGAQFGAFVGRTLGYRWKVTIDNIHAAYPELGEKEVRELAVSAYASVGTTLFELLRVDRFDLTELRKFITLEGEQIVTRAHAAGKGLILLSAHYGSWELIPHALSAILGLRGSVLVRGLANPWINQSIDRLRRSSGMTTVPSTLAVRQLFRVLERGGVVMMAADQSAPLESPIVQFFGRSTPAYEGPAVLALRTGAAIIFSVARRTESGSYQLTFENISHDDLVPREPGSVIQLTERCLAATERAIRQNPSQWMWMHRRWKHVVPAS